MPRVAQVVDGLADVLQGDAGVQQPLDDLQHEDVAEGVQPLRARAGGAADRRRDEAGTGPVVQLPVGDPCSGAGSRAAVADEVGVDLVVRGSTDCGVAEELTLGAVVLVAHVQRPPLSRPARAVRVDGLGPEFGAIAPTGLRCHTAVVRATVSRARVSVN